MAAAAILDNFEWPYLRNGSRFTYSMHRVVIFAIAQLSCCQLSIVRRRFVNGRAVNISLTLCCRRQYFASWQSPLRQQKEVLVRRHLLTTIPSLTHFLLLMKDRKATLWVWHGSSHWVVWHYRRHFIVLSILTCKIILQSWMVHAISFSLIIVV